MDNWQKSLYEKLKDFAGECAEHVSVGDSRLILGITQPEAYVLVKALELINKEGKKDE